MRLGWLALTLLVIGSVGMSGCTAGCSASNSSSGQVAVCNEKGSFSYSTNAGMTTKTDSYTWENPASKAVVQSSMNMGVGSATVTIKDAAGKQVFSKTFQGSGQAGSSETTQEGQAGAWQIEVKMTGASGQVAFQVNSA